MRKLVLILSILSLCAWAQEEPRAKDFVEQNAIASINVPENIIINQLRKSLITPKSIIKEINNIKLSPINRLFHIDFIISLPAGVIHSLKRSSNQDSFKQDYKIRASVKMPSPSILSQTGYFRVEFVKVTLDGIDVTNTIDLMKNMLGLTILNSNLIQYLVSDVKNINNRTLVNDLHNFFDQKYVRFNDRALTIKLDPTQFQDFKKYKDFSDLKLWFFSPALISGSDSFRIEIGRGKPNEAWKRLTSYRAGEESKSQKQANQEVYDNYSNANKLNNKIDSLIKEVIEKINLQNLRSKQTIKLHDFTAKAKIKAQTIMSLDNEEFEAYPENVYSNFFNEFKEEVHYFIANLKRINNLEIDISKSGDKTNKDEPILVNLVSQSTMNQATRFFREFDLMGENFFSEFNIVIAPQMSGLVLKGVFNFELSEFLELCSLNYFDYDNIPIRASGDKYGSGIPAEIPIRTYFLDNGWLGLDANHISLFSGADKIVLTQNSSTGSYLLNAIKGILAKTLAAMIIEPPQDDSPDETYDKLIEKLKDHKEAMEDIKVGNNPNVKDLLKVSGLDIAKNPFLTIGQEYIKGKLKWLFTERVKYDQSRELLLIKIDPKLVSENIMNQTNTFQVWNAEPLYRYDLNKTFIELAVGNNTRSANYVQALEDRPEREESEDFSGTDESRDSSTLDFRTSMNIQHFENTINQLLAHASHEAKQLAENELKKYKEYNTTIIENIDLEVIADGQLDLNLTTTSYRKYARSALNPARYFKGKYNTIRQSITLRSSVKLKTALLDSYLESLPLLPNESFFSDYVLDVDLSDIEVTFGNASLFQTIISRGFGLSKSKALKSFILNQFVRFFHGQNQKTNENINLGGFRLNNYVKILPHQHEILLQINPRLFTPAFDVQFLSEQNFNGTPIGFVIDKESDTITFDFRTNGAMATVDKGDLYKIIEDTQELFKPYLQANQEQLKEMLQDQQLFANAINNSDLKKPSLYHRFIAKLAMYDGVIDNTIPDLFVARQIEKQFGNRFESQIMLTDQYYVTASGIEVIYFLMTADVLRKNINALIKKMDPNDSYYFNFKKTAHKLESFIIAPLIELYEKAFIERNQKIVNKGVTDWNHTYYADALFAEKIYKLIKN